MILRLSLAILSSVLLTLGLLMMKSRSAHLPPAVGRNIVSAIVAWLRDPIWIGGLGIQFAGYIFYVIAISSAPVSMIAVMMQGGIALFVIMSVVFLGERARPREWVGIVAIVFAMVMLTMSLSAGGIEGTLSPRALLILSAVLIAGGAAPMAIPGLRRSGTAPAILSGVAFGLGALCAKAMTEEFIAHESWSLALRVAANPYVYGAIITNIVGIVMLQNSFHSARGIIAMPISSALSNVVPIAGGMIVFGESLPTDTSAAAMRIGAFILTIAAGALLSVSHESSPSNNPHHRA